MKKLLSLLLVSVLTCGISPAQDVEVTFNDSKVIKGTSKTDFMYENAHTIKVKDATSGEKTEYLSADIKSIRYHDAKSEEWITFVPVAAQGSLASLWNKNPKPYKHPVFMIPLYEGKHVSAYQHYITTKDYIFGKNQSTSVTGTASVYFYKIKGEDLAIGYGMTPALVNKKWFRFIFKKYPEMKEVVESYDKDDFYKDPTDIIKKFDAVLK